jgi:hypothetical protein
MNTKNPGFLFETGVHSLTVRESERISRGRFIDPEI